VKGAPVTSAEPDLLDAIWLKTHPGWSWTDLQSTPAVVIQIMGRADYLTSREQQP